MTRYALYFTPASGSSLWEAGCRWLGRDALSGVEHRQPEAAGIPPFMLRNLTSQARRYGFHATLKAPFLLADGFEESHLLTMAEAFVDVQHPVALDDLKVKTMGDFLALRPADMFGDIGALAMRCVSHFDLLRAPPSSSEMARRRNAGLTQRQETLLQRWGYPYVEDEFRFHITLTDSLAALDDDALYALRKSAEAHFAPVLQKEPQVIDALTIFRESEPGAPFHLWKRLPFRASARHSMLPACGRLFFIVGPSGVGKDTLMKWLEQQMPDGCGVVFAQRTITRPLHPSETHECIEETAFWEQAASGRFSMTWQAHGLCYGIRRGIEAELKSGRDVIVNGSREYIPQLRRLFPEAKIIWIDAAPEQIRRRIEARQRESGAALLRRLDRVTRFTPPDDADVIYIDNSGPVEVAGRRLLALFCS